MKISPHSLLFLFAIFILAEGCATKPSKSDTIAYAAYEEINDPIEPLNRYFFELTRFADFLFLGPLAEIYTTIVPKFPREMLDNFYTNLREPLYLANNLLQGSWERSGVTLGRFTINTTLGLVGFFDVADYWFGLEVKSEDFGQTLAVYGMPEGPFLFLPFLGPSSFRDAIGAGGEIAGDPFRYISRIPALEPFETNSEIIIQMRGPVRALEFRGSSGNFISQVERQSIDYYATIRAFYRQNRRNAILNGEFDFDDLPEIPDDDFLEK